MTWIKRSTTLSSALVTFGYMESLPVASGQLPTIIFLHGSGERGSGSATDLDKILKAGLPKTMNGKPLVIGGQPFIVLCPQTNKWDWKNDGIVFAKWALENYPQIDPTRVYLTGLSMGGEGVWFTAAHASNSPNIFAAIAPVCGRANRNEGTIVGTRKIPVWAFHGHADLSIRFEAAWNPLITAREKNFSGTKFTVYEDIEHNSWDRAYRMDNTLHKQNLYQWFLTKRKA
jgi:predicted peptidase